MFGVNGRCDRALVRGFHENIPLMGVMLSCSIASMNKGVRRTQEINLKTPVFVFFILKKRFSY